MKRVLLVLVIGLAIFVSPARAFALAPMFYDEISVSGATPAQQARIMHVLREDRAPLPPFLTIIVGPCPEDPTAAACNLDGAGQAVYLAPKWISQMVILRETGGRYWSDVLRPSNQAEFATFLDSSWPATKTPGTGVAERFEDAYSDCALGLKPAAHAWDYNPAWVDVAGYDPSPRLHRRVCAFIQNVNNYG